jgi:hypothetical protein
MHLDRLVMNVTDRFEVKLDLTVAIKAVLLLRANEVSINKLRWSFCDKPLTFLSCLIRTLRYPFHSCSVAILLTATTPIVPERLELSLQ